jgi:hypothetical protein
MNPWPALLIACAVGAMSLRAQDTYTLTALRIGTPVPVLTGGEFTLEDATVGDSKIVTSGGEFDMEATIQTVVLGTPDGDVVLTIRLVEGGLEVEWTAHGYLLERAEALVEGGAGVWFADTGVPEVVGGVHRVRVNASAEVRFFRLVNAP